METIYQPEYLDSLKRIIEETPEAVMVVCRAWYGETFGLPGYGSVATVQTEIEHAKRAIDAYQTYLRLTPPYTPT